VVIFLLLPIAKEKEKKMPVRGVSHSLEEEFGVQCCAFMTWEGDHLLCAISFVPLSQRGWSVLGNFMKTSQVLPIFYSPHSPFIFPLSLFFGFFFFACQEL
jgi:hypothetical protein